MALKTYAGSCHCGVVRYEADVDLMAVTGRCNCSFCGRTRAWSVLLKPDAFRLVSGADAMSDYQFATMAGHHRFCKTCGVTTHGDGDIAALGGKFVSVAVATLGASDEELAAAPIMYQNGRDNDWQHAPNVTSYL